jgi:MFS family permease
MLYSLKRFPALAYKDFRIFLPSQFISNTGSQMQFVALNWHIYELTHSPLALGLIGLLRFLPILLFSLIGGSVADAHNRKKVLYITESSLAVLSIILAYFTFTNTITPLIIFTITALTATCIAFEVPARQAFVPNLIDKKDLQNAMSIFAIINQTSMILGPALSGVLIANSGLALIYILNAISFIVVLMGLVFISNDGQVIGPKTTFSFAAIKEGLHFVRNKTIIWSTMLLDFFSTFFSTAAALIPIFAKDILNVGPVGLGLLYSAFRMYSMGLLEIIDKSWLVVNHVLGWVSMAGSWVLNKRARCKNIDKKSKISPVFKFCFVFLHFAFLFTFYRHIIRHTQSSQQGDDRATTGTNERQRNTCHWCNAHIHTNIDKQLDQQHSG